MCLFPQKARLNDLGRIEFNHEGDLKLPCGRCNECISKRAIEWATRARHEIASHKENCFITLTYNEENLPSILVVKNEFQKFIKRLRKFTKLKLRYMVSHEYGTKNFRPHHHAIIFGYNPKNQKFNRTTPRGEKLFISDEIEKIWKNGFHSIGTANEKTAYYIASYSLKGKKHSFPDPVSGEIIQVSDCMDVSKRPAIGYNFLEENYKQMIDSKSILPRYYAKCLNDPKKSVYNPGLFEMYENERMLNFKNRSSHEIYAKYIIDKQKNNIKSEFRERDATLEESEEYYNSELLTNRDDYVSLTRKSL
jgi:hypothetical protein